MSKREDDISVGSKRFHECTILPRIAPVAVTEDYRRKFAGDDRGILLSVRRLGPARLSSILAGHRKLRMIAGFSILRSASVKYSARG